MSLKQEYCPTCASPNTFVIGERSHGPHHEVKRECTCGETWWSPVPLPTSASAKQQVSSPIDGWAAKLIQNVRELSTDPDRLHELTERGF